MAQEFGLSWKDCKVLIVDDEPFSRIVLKKTLMNAGLTKIDLAENGKEALQKVTLFHPDLILLDINMPEMNGYDCCLQLRQDPANADLPVIFQTGLNSEAERAYCFDAGGTDVVSKPINAKECVARVRLHLERLMLIRNLRRFTKRVEGELAMARTMQAALVPEPAQLTSLSDRYGCHIEAHFESCSELGGDFWTYFEIDDQHLGFLVADFAGHGIAAALNAFRLHTLLSRTPPESHDPGKWLSSLNTHLRKLLPVGQFCTAFFGILNCETRVMDYAAASSPRPILLHGDKAQVIDSHGMFLGVTPMADYETRRILIPEDAHLIFYSDAITEARNLNDSFLGKRGLLRFYNKR